MAKRRKSHSRRGRLVLAATVSLLALTGCGVTQQSALNTAPEVATVSPPNDLLRRMPLPSEKTIVAVYQYDDLTGQYKERDDVQTLSRAVTQGGAPMLIKALQDAGEGRWFSVLERSELDNLLRERQILTEMRRLYRNETRLDADVLPPLMHASIIIEGGIIGYDTNTITGGAGARFLGIGGDTRYQHDTVTVTLRAVSAKSGEVLTTVTARKSVASHALQGGAFRYLKLDELLEAEAGVTYNEPKQIAVEAAIEAAVQALIVEGAALNVWSFQDRQQGAAYIEAYRHRKYGDRRSLLADMPLPPRTAEPAKITETVALAPRRSAPARASQPARQAAPTQSQSQQRRPQQEMPAESERRTPPAPPPDDGEVLGQVPLPTQAKRADNAQTKSAVSKPSESLAAETVMAVVADAEPLRQTDPFDTSTEKTVKDRPVVGSKTRYDDLAALKF